MAKNKEAAILIEAAKRVDDPRVTNAVELYLRRNHMTHLLGELPKSPKGPKNNLTMNSIEFILWKAKTFHVAGQSLTPTPAEEYIIKNILSNRQKELLKLYGVEV